MAKFMFFIFILIIIFICTFGEKTSCVMKETCGMCIQDKECIWCAEPPQNKKNPIIRCQPIHLKKPGWCNSEHIINPTPEMIVKKNITLRSLKNNEAIQIQPQEVHLKIRRNQEYHLDFYYSQAQDYPVDLYYLMDLSASMEDDKHKLATLGYHLVEVMKNITSDFRLGFGSFVDKPDFPFVKDRELNSSCILPVSKTPCAPAYSFKNHLNLTEDMNRFTSEVSKAPVSGNLDSPEGGFDAIMQSIVCQEEIGWRQQARHLLVFSTDATSHIAGDGKLAGIVEPNDEKCHLDEKGYYTKALNFDYPSVSQINKVAKKNNINLIFAATQNNAQVYKDLKEIINGATFGYLSEDSSNIVQLVKNIYDELTNSVTITDDSGSFVEIKYYSSCLTSDTPKETNECDGIRVNTRVKFTAVIKAVECLPNKRDWSRKIEIKPRFLNESLIIHLDVICDCPCEREGHEGFVNKSPECKSLGNLQCGVCSCQSDRFGRYCECDKTASDTDSAPDDFECKPTNTTTDVCSGHGSCKCHKCECHERSNPNENYYGKYCECDNFSCSRNAGLMCSNRGTCDCGLCKCYSGWSGPICECPNTNLTCISPEGKEICSGRGNCECGACKCNTTPFIYSGKYCEECATCPNQKCDEIKDCVECQAYKSGKHNENDCKLHCTSFEVKIVDEIEIPNSELDEENIKSIDKVCSLPDESKCIIVYKYRYDTINENLIVYAQKEKKCPVEVNFLHVALWVIGSIIIAGIILLLIWKLITEVHDKREFANFEKERLNAKWDRGDNPLYKPSTSTFTNPTFQEDKLINHMALK